MFNPQEKTIPCLPNMPVIIHLVATDSLSGPVKVSVVWDVAFQDTEVSLGEVVLCSEPVPLTLPIGSPEVPWSLATNIHCLRLRAEGHKEATQLFQIAYLNPETVVLRPLPQYD
ncbi:hypothetical protein GMRT_20210 [Giardia muris]|uniref:Uncharacterized protein n=1 Tax=Giardia muris TaxID=5742 RepID=A0A4Z1SU75_GIAMU|nr:hypothetical protein GMRT_20210 [Giardia muris]|eukprot:TNJ29426.1 hypothetical protein GMRT_20210 [Giardia muris]